MTGAPPPRTRLLGSLRADGGTGTVRMHDRVDAAVSAVWSALTEPAQLAGWYGQVDGDLREGGEYRASLHATGWQGTGRVLACEPRRRLAVTARGQDGQPEQTLEVTLTADTGQTLVTWEERGIPAGLLAAYGAGIQIHVEDLTAFLAGRGRCDAMARWAELSPLYEALAPAGAAAAGGQAAGGTVTAGGGKGAGGAGAPPAAVAVSAQDAQLLDFLAGQRASVLAIVDGLDEQAWHKSVVPTGWTPAGMLEHLAGAEFHWFQMVVAGVQPEPPDLPGGGEPEPYDISSVVFTSGMTSAEVIAQYREICAQSDAVLAVTPLSAAPRGRHDLAGDPEPPDVRWVVQHLIEETARHAGHLDIARELLDGATRRGGR